MSNYYSDLTFASEEFVIKNLNLYKRTYKKKVDRNNEIDISDYDIKISDKLVDVQTSFNFFKYGDLRIDILSAFSFKNKYSRTFPYKQVDLLNSNLLENELNIYKFGKWFDDRLHGCIFLLFNSPRPNLSSVSKYDEFINKNLIKIVYLTRSNLANYLEQNKNNLQNIKVNDKKRNNINEYHQSAFLPINLNKIKNDNFCEVYNNLNDFRLSFNL
tara:strand:+ start:57 stop:701 length:645 start_codon:yes stop_codon:yes gene_type:complete